MDQERNTIRLADSELKVMEVLWKEGDCSAKHISDVMTQRFGWNINSTYTLIKRCIQKGALERREPGFLCHPLLSCDEVRRSETEKLLDKVFDGSVDLLFSALIGSGRLSGPEVSRLREKLEALEEGSRDA